jgi:hypothetical protein
MRRQKWIINLVLLALAAMLVVKLRGDWMLANQRYATIKPQVKPVAVAPNIAAPGGLSANPATISMADAIVQNNLFSPDRNNNVPPPVQKHEPPPEPILLGAMDIGGGPIALMAEGGERPGPARQVKIGDAIGGYKLVKVAGSFVMVEWEGEQKRLEVQFAPQQIRGPQASDQRAAQPVVVGPTTPVPSNVTNATNKPTPQNPSGNSTGDKNTRTSFDMFGPGVQDNFPAGTIRDGWKKVEHPWPFGGKQVWWEKVQQ